MSYCPLHSKGTGSPPGMTGGKGSGEAEFTARSCFCYLGERRETHTCRKMLQVKGTLPSWESDVSIISEAFFLR